jgi:5-methylcytosine-specific restriction endonuclease McrA
MTREEAIATGRNRFFTGIPCRNGHVCERIASTNKCVECHRVTKQKYYFAHPELARARNQKWQENNREKVRAANRKWAAGNPDCGKAASARHYEKCKQDSEKMKERSRKTKTWRQSYPEKHCAQSCKWQASNPIKAGAIQQARRARKRGAEGRYTKEDIDRLFELQRSKCALVWCRKSIKSKFHVDHVMPLALGGSNWPSNLQLLCPTCNIKKHAKHPVVFAQENGMLL